MSPIPDFQSSSIELGGVRTRLLERPAAADLTLLFVHGWADSADTFKPLMAELADLPARLVAVDLPNFGQAQDLQPGPQLPQFVTFVCAAVEHFGTRGRLLPVGQSLGGRSLLMALNQMPPRPQIEAAVVIGPAPLDLPPWQKMLVRNGSLSASASRLGDELPFDQLRAEFLKSFQRTCLADPNAVAESVYDDYLRHYTLARIARHMEALRLIGAELQQPLDFSRLQLPVEIIWGERDRMAPLPGSQRYLEALPRARLTVFEGCGHHAHLERVAATAAIVRRLVQATGAS